MISYGKTVYTYEAEYILCGVGGEKQLPLTFYKAQYTLSDIIEWGEVTTYQVSEKFELLKHDPAERVLYEDDKIKIIYKVYGSMLPVVETELLKEKIELEQHGLVEIQSKEDNTLDYYNNLFWKIKKLIEISSLRKINTEKMEVYSKDVFDLYGETRLDRSIRIYGISVKKYEVEEIKTTFRRFSWITLTELLNNNSFKTYFEKYELMEPVLELFIETIYRKSSNQRVFLNLVQALETYHSRFVTNNLSEYKNRVDIISKSLLADIEEKNKVYLLANSKKFITLESRLADLLFAENKINFDTGDIAKKDFPEVVAKTRNYYIHYDESLKEHNRILSVEELGIYNGVLFFVLEYYLLKELGFSMDGKEIREKLKERWER